MLEILGLEAMIFSLWIERRDNKSKALTLKKDIYRLRKHDMLYVLVFPW